MWGPPHQTKNESVFSMINSNTLFVLIIVCAVTVGANATASPLERTTGIYANPIADAVVWSGNNQVSTGFFILAETSKQDDLEKKFTKTDSLGSRVTSSSGRGSLAAFSPFRGAGLLKRVVATPSKKTIATTTTITTTTTTTTPTPTSSNATPTNEQMRAGEPAQMRAEEQEKQKTSAEGPEQIGPTSQRNCHGPRKLMVIALVVHLE